MNSHHAKRTLKESMGYKVFAVFMAFTLCLPTTLTSNLTNMRQAQAATEAAQEYASADGGDSAATDTDSSFDSSSDAAQGSSSRTDGSEPLIAKKLQKRLNFCFHDGWIAPTDRYRNECWVEERKSNVCWV